METVLIIEDSRPMQRTLQRLFEADSLGVRIASDGVEGLESFRQEPPNVVVLKVVEINGKAAKRPPPAAADQPPALPATLDITVDLPGNIFVRGHGLESEWRGRLAITGTSAAPAIPRSRGCPGRSSSLASSADWRTSSNW